MDSGSSRHIDAATVVTDESDTYHVSGFDGSEAWTKGSGNLALELTDASTKRPFTVILDDVDKFESARPILSMGKLLRDGYEFILKDHGDTCLMRAPNKKRMINLHLGDDDIVTLPHTLLVAPKPKGAQLTCLIQRNMAKAPMDLLHITLGHASLRRIELTLQCTSGFKQRKLHPVHCPACAIAKSRAQGISRSRPPALSP